MPFPNEYRGDHDRGRARRARARVHDAWSRAENVAAIVFEPVQGEGGFIVAPPEFVQGLRRLCDKHGIVLVADEVQTGFGAHRAVLRDRALRRRARPDLRRQVDRERPAALRRRSAAPRSWTRPSLGGVGGTYVGNPVAQAAALAVLDVIDEEGLVERSAAIGETIRARMLAWQERWPAIGDVRGLGAMLAIELVADPATQKPAKELAQRVTEEALRARPAADHLRRLRQLHPRPRSARDRRRGARRGARRLGRGARSRARLRHLGGNLGIDGRRRGRGPVRARAARRRRRHVERLPGARPGARADGGAEDAPRAAPPRTTYVERFSREARDGRGPLAPQHRRGDRPRRARRQPLHRLRVHRRREPEAARRPRRAAARRAGARARRSRSRAASRSPTRRASSTATSSRRTCS